MKNLILLTLTLSCALPAVAQEAAAAKPAAAEKRVSTQITYREPEGATTNLTIPIGWELVEMKDKPVEHGPVILPNGSPITFNTPSYVLSPITSEGAVYLTEPGFQGDHPSGDPRAATLGVVLLGQMEGLRVGIEELRALSLSIQALKEKLGYQDDETIDEPLDSTEGKGKKE